MLNSSSASSSSRTTTGKKGHSLYAFAFVVGLSNASSIFNAIIRRANGFIFIGSLRDICLKRHSNCRAACQSGNPEICAARIHVQPCATLIPVACAPPFISLLCCRKRRSKSTVAPTYVASHKGVANNR